MNNNLKPNSLYYVLSFDKRNNLETSKIKDPFNGDEYVASNALSMLYEIDNGDDVLHIQLFANAIIDFIINRIDDNNEYYSYSDIIATDDNGNRIPLVVTNEDNDDVIWNDYVSSLYNMIDEKIEDMSND